MTEFSTPNERQALLSLHQAALQAVDPYYAVKRILQDGQEGHGPLADALAQPGRFPKIVVVGAGKASARMAAAAEEMLGSRIADGVLVVKHGHTAKLTAVRQIEASALEAGAIAVPPAIELRS